MRPLYIFDIDGTVALIDHRRRFLDMLDNPNRWREFYAACDLDTPNRPVIATLKNLITAGAEIWFFSGRSSEVRDKTVAWLADNTPFMTWDLEGPMLRMRDEGDCTADDELKFGWYDGMLIDDKQRLVAVFDDRDRVVSMWRKAGVCCFQVAEGNF